jgi:predicted PurR-regulated permease PerM
LKLHTVLAFMSVLGGVMLFGPAGLILGPVTLTLTTVLLEIWSGRAAANKAQLPDNASEFARSASTNSGPPS